MEVRATSCASLSAAPATAEIGVGDVDAVVAEFPAHGQPGGVHGRSGGGGEAFVGRATLGRRLLAREHPVAPAGVPVPVFVDVGDPGLQRCPLEGLAEADVGHAGRDERAVAADAVHLVQEIPLALMGEGNRPRAAALAPTGRHGDVGAPVSGFRLELEALLQTEPESHLEANGELHAFGQRFHAVSRGGVGPVPLERRGAGDAEVAVALGDDSNLLDLARPPTHPRQPVLDGRGRDAP